MFGRRWTVVAVAGGLLVSSCGGAGDGGTGVTRGAAVGPAACGLNEFAAADKPVDVTFWHSMLLSTGQWLVKRIRAFNASQDEVRVRLTEYPKYTDILDKYRFELGTGGDLPDLVQLEETAVQQMLDTHSTIDVQSCVDASGYDMSDFLDRPTAYYSTDGVLHSMPWVVTNPILIFDAAKFEAAGLDPADPPQTLEEVREYSRKIVSSGAAKHGIALKIEPFVFEFMLAKSGGVYVDHSNGRHGRATAATFGDETGLAIWQWWKDMVDSGLALDMGSYLVQNYDNVTAVATDQAAMTIEASSILSGVQSILESGRYPGVVAGAGPLPALGTGGGVPVGDSSLWIPSASDPAKRAAAWKVIDYLLSPTMQAEVAVQYGSAPIRESAIDEPILQAYWAAHPLSRIGYDQVEQGSLTDSNSGSLIGAYAGVREAVRNGMVRMLEQDDEPLDAIRAAQTEATSAIEAYNALLVR